MLKSILLGLMIGGSISIPIIVLHYSMLDSIGYFGSH
jgi:hypothetical protein